MPSPSGQFAYCLTALALAVIEQLPGIWNENSEFMNWSPTSLVVKLPVPVRPMHDMLAVPAIRLPDRDIVVGVMVHVVPSPNAMFKGCWPPAGAPTVLKPLSI